MKKNNTNKLSSEDILNLAKKAVEIAIEKKAIDVKLLDLRDLTTMTDFFIICSGQIDEHMKAIVKAIEKGLIDNIQAHHIEGYSNQKWILMDYFDFVIHVFNPETRDYYNLEKLWSEAPLIEY